MFAKPPPGAAGRVPIVEVDLDLTAVMPIYRTRQALIAAGEATGVETFLQPELLPILPGYSDEAWTISSCASSCRSSYPAIPWILANGSPDSQAGRPIRHLP